MSLRLASGLVLFSFACGGTGDDAGGVDAGPTCAPLEAHAIATGSVEDAAYLPEGLAVLIGRAGALYLDVVGPTGAVTEQQVAAVGARASLAVDPQGRACAAWVDAQPHVQVACAPTWQAVDTGLAAERDSEPFLAYETSACATAGGGCVPMAHWVLHFEGHFASASYAESDDAATWTETDLFISSVTFPTSVASMAGQVVGCISGNGGATLVTYHPYRGDIGDVQRWSAGGRCLVAAAGRALHLVASLPAEPTQLTYGTWDFPYLPDAPWSAPAALEAQPTLRLQSSSSPRVAAIVDGALVLTFVDATGATVSATRGAAGWSVAPLASTASTALAMATATGAHATVATQGSDVVVWQACR